MKFFFGLFLGLLVVAMAYLLLWPVPVEPVAWDAPRQPSYTGVYQQNHLLADLEMLSLADNHGPEDVVKDASGNIFVSTHEGWIMRMDKDGKAFFSWVNTGGRPLGMQFDNQGDLLVADAFVGLIAINSKGEQRLLTNTVNGEPILFANDLDIASDGKVYFSEASTKFDVSQLDIIEHGGHGRMLVYNPETSSTHVLIDDLQFANGVTLDPEERFLLFNETGAYRVIKYWLQGPKAGQTEMLLDNLPGFPDNLSRGHEGRFWLGLAAPRISFLDNASNKPWLRKVALRLPSFLRPVPVSYGHVIAFDSDGNIIKSMQDPLGVYPSTTGVLETDEYLYISSLTSPFLGRLIFDTVN